MSKKETIYGLHAVEALLDRAPERLRQLWALAGRDDRRMSALLARVRAQGVPVQSVKRETLDRLAGQGRHQGVVAEIVPRPPGDEQQLAAALAMLPETATVLVLDGIQDPHNLGACLRTADAAGTAAVVLPRDKAVGLSAVVRKVACGAAETVPVFAVTNLARVLDRLKESGFWLYGAAGESEDSLYEQRLVGRIAWVLGAEGAGLRRLTRDKCDLLVHIPMSGAVASLNVSVATGIVLFETRRQRLLAAGD